MAFNGIWLDCNALQAASSRMAPTILADVTLILAVYALAQVRGGHVACSARRSTVKFGRGFDAIYACSLPKPPGSRSWAASGALNCDCRPERLMNMASGVWYRGRRVATGC